MIKTGLPYAMNQMEEIAKNGAIVDMSDLKFPGIQDEKASIRTAFIFLRNTGFPVTADYSKCDYEMKAEYLHGYFDDGIESKQDELASTWLAACFKYLEIEYSQPSIMTDEELLHFCSENVEKIREVIRYTKSIPVFMMSLSSLDGEAYDTSAIERVAKSPAKANIENIFFADELGLIVSHKDEFEPAFYEDTFTEENHELVSRLCKSNLFSAMNGLVRGSKKDWKAIMKFGDDSLGR